eukprot:scaffold32906_cov34-Tisochrysis_lutea.AAC.3
MRMIWIYICKCVVMRDASKKFLMISPRARLCVSSLYYSQARIPFFSHPPPALAARPLVLYFGARCTGSPVAGDLSQSPMVWSYALPPAPSVESKPHGLACKKKS